LPNIEINLPFGDSFLPVTLPSDNVCSVIEAKRVPAVKDEREAIQKGLRNPIESDKLLDRIHNNDKVLIIITDNTRHCPDNKILPVILDELEQKVPRRNITCIVALGLHPPLSREALIKKLGKRIVNDYKVLNHDPDEVVSLGTTSFGTPVEVNSELTKADFRISIGFIEPHFFAGFSGGRKSVAPGLSGADTIRKNHGYAMIEHPNAQAGILKGNPIHEDLVEQAKMANLDFIVNVLLNREKQISHVFAGDPWLAHELGCDVEKEIVGVEADRQVDIAIVTNGGAPLDLDFYQTCKGIYTASLVTRPGGVIIVASSCSNGFGPEAFKNLHSSNNSPREVLEKIRDGHHFGVDWQNQILAHAQLEHVVYLLSNLADEEVKQMMVTPIHTIEQGLDEAFGILGKQAEIAVIPEGPLILPIVSGADR
jgi:nickel-dependent lactate racemase